MTNIFKNPISKKYSRSYIDIAQGLVRSDKNKRFFKIALTSCKDLEKNLNKKYCKILQISCTKIFKIFYFNKSIWVRLCKILLRSCKGLAKYLNLDIL